jgi:hypothetical protein
MSCGCGKRKAYTRKMGLDKESLRQARAEANAIPKERFMVTWLSSPPSGDESDPYWIYTISELRTWEASHPGWTTETVRTPIPT